MKKVLFLSLILSIGMMGFAQRPLNKKSDIAKANVLTQVQNKIETEAPAENFNHEVMTRAAQSRDMNSIFETETMISNFYDLQSNSALGNRIATWPDGSVAVTMTWDNSESSSYTNRGTGYNYYDGEAFGDMPEDRVESSYSGWPSIAPVGNGEILASHGGGNVNIFKRETKGEGEWEQVAQLKDCTWPRIATTGDGQYVHVVCAEQDANNTIINYVYYSRSTDYGQTFTEIADPPQVDVAGMYRNDIGADDYVIATNGNTIAILFASMNYDVFYIISRDNGETWEKQIVAPFPYDHSIDWNQTAITSDTDSIWCCDNTANIAVDDNGVVHVVFALSRWAPAPDSGAGYYTYWPFTQGIVYWNSEYTNEQGGHEIPMFGDWSGDAAHPDWAFNGTNGVANTLMDDRLWELAEADGHQHLHLFGFVDDNNNGVYGEYTDLWDNHGDANSYRTHGIATMPCISVDNWGNIACMYSCLSETRIWTSTWYYRGAYLTFREADGTWHDDVMNLNADFTHAYGEVYYTTAASQGVDGSFWFAYMEDSTPGLFVDGDGAPSTPNSLYAVQITPTDEPFWGVKEQEAVNPMTSVRVYPNPATDVLNIEVNASQSSAMSINVYNIMGQKVMEQNVNVNAGVNVPTINTADFTSGIYFVTVKANGFENTMKFIVK